MTQRLKRSTCWSLYWTCWALDRLPYYDRVEHRWYGYQLGCALGVAQLACRLETCWGL